MGIAFTPLDGFSDAREPGYDFHKSIAGTFRLTTLGLGLAVAFSPSAMAGGHHQKGQLIAVPATSVASQPAQMSYVQPAQMSYVQPVQMSYINRSR